MSPTGARAPPAAVLAVLLCGLLAGCTSDTPSDDGPVEYHPDGGGFPDLFGRVLDGQERPLPQADVRIPELDLATVSDDEGYFDFGTIDHEGRVLVEATKQDHHRAETDVLMAPDLAAQVVFRLPLLEGLGPRVLVQEFNGFIACRAHAAGTAQDCPGSLADGDQRSFTLDIPLPDEERLDAVTVRLEWDATGPGSETLRVQAGPEAVTESVTGASPLALEVEAATVQGLADDPVLRIQVDVDPDTPGVTFAQRFDGTVESVTVH